MIRGQIIIKLTSGSTFTYANSHLLKKDGKDEDGNPKFEGFNGYNYYYTGGTGDKYEDQTEPGEIKSDYEFLLNQMDTVKDDSTLEFPENDEGPIGKSNAGKGIHELVRPTCGFINTGKTFSRTKIFINEIVSIDLKEDWVDFPYGRESGYQFPKDSPNFKGFNETDDITDRGPDFDKYWTTKDINIPRPDLILGDKNEPIILNANEFSRTVEKASKYGIESYGIVEKKNEKGEVVDTKNSGTIFKPFHPYTIIRDVNNKEIELKLSPIIVKKDSKINYENLDGNEKFNFKEWTLDEAGKEKDLPNIATENFTIFAQWEASEYNVTKNLNYSKAPKPETIKVKYGTSINYGDNPLRDGYTFEKWTSDKEGKVDAPKKMDAKDIIVYAQWKKVQQVKEEPQVLKTAAAPKKTTRKSTKKVEPKVEPEAELEPIDGKE